MALLDGYIDRLFEREGYFTDSKLDRGGPTKFGITLSTLTFYRHRPCTIDDIKNLSKAEAADIYKTLYFLNHHLDLLPDELEEQVFDFAVLSGPQCAIQALQESLGLKPDGVLGPITLAAAVKADSRQLNNKIVIWRCMMLARICRKDPTQLTFLQGWLSRALSFLR